MSFPSLSRAVWLLFPGMILLTPNAQAQEWSWPERPENLQVLPSGWSGDRLRPVMQGFTRALGVRCSYCHVGEEGQPLTMYDFASDANPKKDVARTMLRLLGVINDSLRTFQTSGPAPVNMWCHTCHQGRPRPTTLEEELRDAYEAGGAAEATARYRDLRERFYGAGALNFGEAALNSAGYAALQAGDAKGAIVLFRLNLEFFPNSANGYDSLAEGYLALGEDEVAKIYYRKSLEIDPSNQNALAKLREIGGG